jgi:chemotaxis signal transduction protein
MDDAREVDGGTEAAGAGGSRSAVGVKLPNGWDTVTDLLRRLEMGQADMQQALGPQYLLFECGGIPCAVPLTELREVLKEVPRTIPLPSVPEWMVGIFPIRSEILALVDPLPALCGGRDAEGESAGTGALPGPTVGRGATLIIGAGERSLALVVDSYGGTVTIEGREMDTRQQAISATGLPVMPRYVAAMYTLADSGQRHAVLRVDLLLDDLISALEKAEARYG